MASRGERLRSALAARGYKQMSLAAELQVSESAVSRWQQDDGLSLEHAGRLCEALDISLDWLVLGRGDMNFHRRLEPPGAHRVDADETVALPSSVRAAINNLAGIIRQELAAATDRSEGRAAAPNPG